MMDLLDNARQYCDRYGIILITYPILGEGEDGKVWRTSNETAVKICERVENYENELECYKRLTKANVFFLDGLAIPRFVNCDGDFFAIEMSIVQAPYLLDFGKVWIDCEPPYIDEPLIVAELYRRIKEDFEENEFKVHSVLYKLKQLGIYYADPRPKNIDFGTEE